MNREIKFRGWDTNGGMVYQDNLLICGNYSGVRKDQTLGDALSIIKNFYNTILMQYTGLKDKNGKEIYEGDIVKIYVAQDWDLSSDSLGEFADYEPKIIEVRWENSGYSFDGEELFSMEYTYPLGSDDFILEIIGNIYENPELLK